MSRRSQIHLSSVSDCFRCGGRGSPAASQYIVHSSSTPLASASAERAVGRPMFASKMKYSPVSGLRFNST